MIHGPGMRRQNVGLKPEAQVLMLRFSALNPIPLAGMVNEIAKLERNAQRNSSDPIPLVGMVKEFAAPTARVVLQSASPSRQAGWGRFILATYSSRPISFSIPASGMGSPCRVITQPETAQTKVKSRHWLRLRFRLPWKRE